MANLSSDDKSNDFYGKREERVRMKTWFGKGLIFGLVLVSDRIAKIWAMENNYGQINTGGVWGLGEHLSWMNINLLIVLLLLYYYKFGAKEMEKWGLVIVIGAGMGNLIDRLWLGGVIDFITYPMLNVVGNLADVWLGVGAIVLARVYLSTSEKG